MTGENGHGTSRGEFLKRTGGAAAVVAGAGVGAGALARSAAAADQRTYTAGRFALDIDGASVGRFVGLDGGNLENEVVNDPPGPDNIQKKHVANVKWTNCTIQTGSGMSASFYKWVKDAFDHGFDSSAARRTSVIAAGSRGEEAFRRSFSQALITEVTIPALDTSSTKVCQIPVTFTSQLVTDSKPSGLPVVAAKQKAWLCSNFRLSLDGINTASRVSKIDSFTWKCAILDTGSPPVIDVGNITVHCDLSILPDFQQWLANLQQGADDERDGSLTIVGGGGVLTIGLFNLGVFGLRPDHAPGQLPNGRFVADMYCERATWDMKKNV